MNIQETVAPEDTGNPGRVERTRSGCHEYFGKVGHICLVGLSGFSRECERYGVWVGWWPSYAGSRILFLMNIPELKKRSRGFINIGHAAYAHRPTSPCCCTDCFALATSPRHPHARAWRQQPAFPVLALCPLSCDSRFGKPLFRPGPCGSRAGAKPQKVPPLQILQRAQVADPSP